VPQYVYDALMQYGESTKNTKGTKSEEQRHRSPNNGRSSTAP
jgi:hypothetical protein